MTKKKTEEFVAFFCSTYFNFQSSFTVFPSSSFFFVGFFVHTSFFFCLFSFIYFFFSSSFFFLSFLEPITERTAVIEGDVLLYKQRKHRNRAIPLMRAPSEVTDRITFKEWLREVTKLRKSNNINMILFR